LLSFTDSWPPVGARAERSLGRNWVEVIMKKDAGITQALTSIDPSWRAIIEHRVAANRLRRHVRSDLLLRRGLLNVRPIRGSNETAFATCFAFDQD